MSWAALYGRLQPTSYTAARCRLFSLWTLCWVVSSTALFPKNIAFAFFKAGFIDKWGLGYKKIMEGFKETGHKLPLIEQVDGGVRVTVWRQNSTSTSSAVPTERLKNITDSIQGNEQISSAEITQAIAQVTTQVKELIASINNESLTKGEILKLHKFKHKSNKTLLEQYFTPAMSLGLLTMEYPDAPRHPRQKYKLTEKGLVVLELIKKM